MTTDIEQRLRATYRVAGELDVPAPPTLGAEPSDDRIGRRWPVFATVTGLAAATLVALVVLAVRPSSGPAATDAARLAAEVWHPVPGYRPEGFGLDRVDSAPDRSELRYVGRDGALLTIVSSRDRAIEKDRAASRREIEVRSDGADWVARWDERPGVTIEITGSGVSRDLVAEVARSLLLVTDAAWDDLAARDGFGSGRTPTDVDDVVLDRSMPGMSDTGEIRMGLRISLRGNLQWGLSVQAGAAGFTGVPDVGPVVSGGGWTLLAAGPDAAAIELVNAQGAVLGTLTPVALPANPNVRLASIPADDAARNYSLARLIDAAGNVLEEVPL